MALADTYSLPPTHAPGQVLVDLAVTIADGGDALRHLRTLRLNDSDDQRILQGLVAQLQKAVDDRAEQLELLPRG